MRRGAFPWLLLLAAAGLVLLAFQVGRLIGRPHWKPAAGAAATPPPAHPPGPSPRLSPGESRRQPKER